MAGRIDLARVDVDAEPALVGGDGYALDRHELDRALRDLRPRIGMDAGFLEQLAPGGGGIGLAGIERAAGRAPERRPIIGDEAE